MKTKKEILKGLKRPLAAFILSLAAVIACFASIFSISASAAMGATTTAPAQTTVTTAAPAQTTGPAQTTTAGTTSQNGNGNNKDSILSLLDPNDNNGTLDLVLLITVLSLAPSILIMMTSFTRIIIVFSLLRNAMGIQQTPPNQVMIGLALFLSLFIMSPTLAKVNDVAYKPYKNGEISTVEAAKRAVVPMKEFMLKQTSNESMQFFLDLAGEEMPKENPAENLKLEVVAPAYIISEIKTAFTIGFLLYIPFLIIDIVVSSTLMSMGIIMLSPAMISLPFKILLFILVDGWQLLCGALVKGFNL
jgi:flagellar biosynthetic protein FliP